MGFFSSCCEGCGHPLLSPMATDQVNEWMSEGVAVFPDGGRVTGVYDGYGDLDGPMFDRAGQRVDRDWASGSAVGSESTVWHQACWEAAGEPGDYRGASRSAEDQGWFFDDGAHSMPDPRLGLSLPAAALLADAGQRVTGPVASGGDGAGLASRAPARDLPLPLPLPPPACGLWMPRAGRRCVLGARHAGPCRSKRP